MAALTGADEPSIAVKIKPAVCFSPCTIDASVSVKAPIGTAICLLLSSEDYERKSCWYHDNYRVTTIRFRSITTGEYEVIAAIAVGTGTKQVKTHLSVVNEYTGYWPQAEPQ